MKEKNEVYLITTDYIEDPTLPLGEVIRSTTAIANNFRKAYDVGLSITGIRHPRIGYKAALNQVNRSMVVTISDDSRSREFVIARIKKW